MMTEYPKIIGLTGGIGCGKTLVSNQFAKLGVPIVDLDIISHQLTAANQPILNLSMISSPCSLPREDHSCPVPS